MNAEWLEFLGARGARIDNGNVSDFGQPAQERAAARDKTVIAPLTQLGLIECGGDDARSFLQNQLTNDVNHLGADAAQHAAWCSPKGRMLASLLLFRQANAYVALLSADLQATIQKRLQVYVLRSRVTIANLAESHACIGLAGPQAEDVLRGAGLPIPSAALSTARFADGTVIHLDAQRFIVIVAHTAANTAWQQMASKAIPVGAPVWDWLDIRAGLPRVVDATREAFVPQMANLDRIGGVSFHKGCYPGQEVVARTQYLGKVKRHLYRATAAAPLQIGTPIHTQDIPGQPCGQVANIAANPDGTYDALAVILEDSAIGGHLYAGTPDVALSGLTPVGD